MKKMKPIEGGGERDISTSLSSSTKEARTIIKIWDIIIFLPKYFFAHQISTIVWYKLHFIIKYLRC